jgi:hypothetical protein
MQAVLIKYFDLLPPPPTFKLNLIKYTTVKPSRNLEI